MLIKFTRHHHHIHTQRTVICTSSHINSKFSHTKRNISESAASFIVFFCCRSDNTKKKCPKRCFASAATTHRHHHSLSPSPLLSACVCVVRLCVCVCLRKNKSAAGSTTHTHTKHTTHAKRTFQKCVLSVAHIIISIFVERNSECIYFITSLWFVEEERPQPHQKNKKEYSFHRVCARACVENVFFSPSCSIQYQSTLNQHRNSFIPIKVKIK